MRCGGLDERVAVVAQDLCGNFCGVFVRMTFQDFADPCLVRSKPVRDRILVFILFAQNVNCYGFFFVQSFSAQCDNVEFNPGEGMQFGCHVDFLSVASASFGRVVSGPTDEVVTRFSVGAHAPDGRGFRRFLPNTDILTSKPDFASANCRTSTCGVKRRRAMRTSGRSCVSGADIAIPGGRGGPFDVPPNSCGQRSAQLMVCGRLAGDAALFQEYRDGAA